MSRRNKALVAIGVLALLGTMAAFALRGSGGDAVRVRVEDVKRRDLVARVTATGHIEPKTSVDISADVSGRIVELPVEEGQDVSEGDLLLVIDPTQFDAALQRSLAALAEAEAREAQARANHQQARRDWERIRQLKEAVSDLVTDTEYEQARTAAEVQEAMWKAARHAVEMARAGVQEARDMLAKTVIRAPMSGRITRLNVEKGETAIVGTMNNPGSLLLTVADLSVMEAVIEVDETDVPEISVGDSATVEIDAFPDRVFYGRVTKIGNSSIIPRASMQARGREDAIDFEVRITLNDPEGRLRPDLSATADVITAVREQVLSIPIIALTLLGPDDFEPIPNENLPVDTTSTKGKEEVEGVFVVEGDIARFRPVEVGIAGDNYFEVASGLEEGETVVSGSYQAIRDLEDGSRIKVTARDSTESPRTTASTR
ncbi:MAG: efflux RND transporter periplasmic adaptor subunit [Gemmatimonadota bacterium]